MGQKLRAGPGRSQTGRAGPLLISIFRAGPGRFVILASNHLNIFGWTSSKLLVVLQASPVLFLVQVFRGYYVFFTFVKNSINQGRIITGRRGGGKTIEGTSCFRKEDTPSLKIMKIIFLR